VSTSEILRRDRQRKEAKREERGQQPRSMRLLRPKAICAKLDIGKTKFWKDFVATGRIRLVDIGPNAKAAPEYEVDDVIEEMIAERDAKLLNAKSETTTPKYPAPPPAWGRAGRDCLLLKLNQRPRKGRQAQWRATVIYILAANPTTPTISLPCLRQRARRLDYRIASDRYADTYSLIDAKLQLPVSGLEHVGLATIANAIETPADQVLTTPGTEGDMTMGKAALQSVNVLRKILEIACAKQKASLTDLTVLSANVDPYRLDTDAGHRDGAWLAAQLNKLYGSASRIHWRGLHYAIVADGKIKKPNGEIYLNTEADWIWLSEGAGKAARFLGYVPFERIIDARNTNIAIHRKPEVRPESRLSIGLDVQIPEAEDIEPLPIARGFVARQAYCFAIFGEKSSLEAIVDPIAAEFESDLYLPSGEISDTLVYQIAKNANADGRPLVVFTLSDCDPAGHQMPISIARKLQAFKDLFFRNLEFEVVTIALNDFLARVSLPHNDVDCICTNPPYGKGGRLAYKLIAHALELASTVAMLLRVDFDSGKTRADLFRDCKHYAHKIVLLDRIVWFEREDASNPSDNHAWFIWEHGDRPRPGEATIYYAGIKDAALLNRISWRGK
jgi:hypothetical protein